MSLEKMRVWEIVQRRSETKDVRKNRVIDLTWIFKRKTVPNRYEINKTRLVVRGFKDENIHELTETYTSIPRLPFARAVLIVANKYNLKMYQFDIKTAFLNSGINDEEIYMEIPEGTEHNYRE